MSDPPARPAPPLQPPASGLYELALRLAPLLHPVEAAQGALAACASLVGAEAGMLLADALPPAALAVAAPAPDEALAIAAAPAVRAAAEMLGVSILPPGAAPLPGAALIAAGVPGAAGRQGVLLLARAAPFEREGRGLLASAMPLVGHTLERARRHGSQQAAAPSRDDAVNRLAHDIRSPLVATQAALDVAQRLLRGQAVPPAVFQALTTGLRSVQAAVELCDDLLELSRLQHGFMITPRPVPLERLIADTCLMMEPLAQQKGLRLQALPPDPALRTLGDERLLRRMLTNLVANGLRFAPPGGLVMAEGLRGDGPGTLLLRVSDNGPGIPPADRERIFVPFAQGQGEAGRGTGLGLALCREVAHAHGGSIWVEDRPGGGTSFLVRLPAV
jgi:signal transduction histidine kinase